MPRITVSILQGLLKPDPNLRLGSGPTDAREIMSHPYFHNINWEDMYHRRLTPDFQPQTNDVADMSNAMETKEIVEEFTKGIPLFTPVQSGKFESSPGHGLN